MKKLFFMCSLLLLTIIFISCTFDSNQEKININPTNTEIVKSNVLLFKNQTGKLFEPKFIGLFRDDSIFLVNNVNNEYIDKLYLVVHKNKVISGSYNVNHGKTHEDRPIIVINGDTVSSEEAKELLSDSIMINGKNVSKSDLRKMLK